MASTVYSPTSHPTRVRGLKPSSLGGSVHIAQSHPTRVRGLKHFFNVPLRLLWKVAPHAGAWIETATPLWVSDNLKSHPTRVRGLKPVFCQYTMPGDKSHPTRVRGLKHGLIKIMGHRRSVAPHAGAWIETQSNCGLHHMYNGRTPRGCVD